MTDLVAAICRQTLTGLASTRELPGLTGIDRDVLHLHQVQVQNILHTQGVSA